MDVPKCRVCYKTFREERFLLSHQRQFAYCRNALALLAATLRTQQDAFVGMDGFDETAPDPPTVDSDDGDDPALDLDELLDDLYIDLVPPPMPLVQPQTTTPVAPPHPPLRSPTAESENIERYFGAASVVREEAPVMVRWAQRHGHADNPYHPFNSKVDWDMGRWAKQEGPGATSLDRLLGFNSVRSFGLARIVSTLPVSALGRFKLRFVFQNFEGTQSDYRSQAGADAGMEIYEVLNGRHPRRGRGVLPRPAGDHSRHLQRAEVLRTDGVRAREALGGQASKKTRI